MSDDQNYVVNVRIEHLKGGQERPYGDTIHEYKVTATDYSYWRTPQERPITGESLLNFARKNTALKLNWTTKEYAQLPLKNERDHGLDTYLDSVVETEPGVVIVRIITPWND